MDKKREGGAESALVTTLGGIYYLDIGSEIPILYSPVETTPISLFSLIKSNNSGKVYKSPPVSKLKNKKKTKSSVF